MQQFVHTDVHCNVAVIWDPAKAKANVEKHSIRFPDAVLALDDPSAITIVDNESDPNEQRCATLAARRTV